MRIDWERLPYVKLVTFQIEKPSSGWFYAVFHREVQANLCT